MHLLLYSGFIFVTAAGYGWLAYEFDQALAIVRWTAAKKSLVRWSAVAALVGWAAFVAFWSVSRRMANTEIFPLNMAPVVVVPFFTVLFLTFSNASKELISLIPIHRLIRMQVFRVAVEFLLWALYFVGDAPIQMTFEGRNFDILAGLTAPVVAVLWQRKKISIAWIVIWNLVCLALLANIVGTVILSLPTPLRVFYSNPSSAIVTRFPVSWLPGMLVPLAYGLHFITLRQLGMQRPKR